MIICRWPGELNAPWEWDPIQDIDFDSQRKDSCVVLYWPYRPLNPGEERHMAFAYGLGKLDVDVGKAGDPEPPKADDSPMALSVPGAAIVPDGEFYVTTYLWKTKPGQKVSISFPDKGLELSSGEKAEKDVPNPGADRTQVSWKVKAPAKPGDYKVQATSGNSRTRPKEVQVRPKDKAPAAGKPVSIFG